MRRICPALLASTVLTAAAPAASFGQALPSDPEADSPSGVVYELPVDRARRDAAPQRDGTNNQSGGGGESSGSGSAPSGGSGSAPSGGSDAVGGVTAGAIRSENNFGTSSEVPGAPSKRKRSAAAGGQDGSGGGDAGDAVKRVAGVAASTTGATTDGPSDGVVFPLLAALLAVGAGIGAVAGRRSLRNRRGG